MHRAAITSKVKKKVHSWCSQSTLLDHCNSNPQFWFGLVYIKQTWCNTFLPWSHKSVVANQDRLRPGQRVRGAWPPMDQFSGPGVLFQSNTLINDRFGPERQRHKQMRLSLCCLLCSLWYLVPKVVLRPFMLRSLFWFVRLYIDCDCISFKSFGNVNIFLQPIVWLVMMGLENQHSQHL